MLKSLLAGIETITRERTFRKNDQLGAIGYRHAGEGIHALEVGRLAAKAHIHLDRGNSKFFRHDCPAS